MGQPKKTRFDIAVADRVREIRRQKGFTQRYIAHALGVSPGLIGQIESLNSETKYSVSQLNRLAKELDCSPRDFLPEEFISEPDWSDL